MNFNSNINRVLLLISAGLIVFIISMLFYYRIVRKKQEEKLSKITIDQTVINYQDFEKITFGKNFDFASINDATLLDKKDNVRFMMLNDRYYILIGDEVSTCEYKNDEYRFCYINNKYKIDFLDYKIIKNNG